MSIRVRRPSSCRLLAIGVAATLCGAAAQAIERTETREPCSVSDPLRLPYFGDLHTHSSRSFDAYLFETRNAPEDAYAFAKGLSVGLAPLDPEGNPTRTLQLERPLDFAAVTDHSELLGELSICTSDHPLNQSPACLVLQNASAAVAFAFWGQGLGQEVPVRFPFCGEDGAACLAEAASVWTSVQDAAEAHYDRTAACTFTTFNAYEWTGSPNGEGIHRNVVYRNQTVPPLPFSYFEASQPEALWGLLDAQCLAAGNGCDVVSIPHNSNQSEGRMFDPNGSDGLPPSVAEAALRMSVEPLVEIVQHKGDSECRRFVGNNDEQCGFEKTTTGDPAADEPLNYVRNALREGLAIEAAIGVNPYALGVIGSTDNHNGTPGAAEEGAFVGHVGALDAEPSARLSGETLRFNPGGLAVLWAEENSRDGLFEAMRRRESYATSGTRPIVRFFGGFELPEDLCGQPDFAARADARGVPMGGELSATPNSVLRFAAAALQDAGTAATPGTPLQRIQIVKGWLEDGETQELVIDVAGGEDNGAGVDLATCEVTGASSAALCSVWEDPDFDPAQPAFYYARVLENPSCRWSQRLCVAEGVDCSVGAPPGFEACCDGSLPQTVQERAITSPIWVRPAPVVPAGSRHSGVALACLIAVVGIGLQQQARRRARRA